MRILRNLNIQINPAVSIPVSMITHQRKNRIPFKTLCPKDNGTVKSKYVCEKCGETVSRKQAKKGYDNGKEIIALDQEQLEALKSDRDKVLPIKSVKRQGDINKTKIKKTYALIPQSESKKRNGKRVRNWIDNSVGLYHLFREYLSLNGIMVLTEANIWGTKRLWAIYPHKNYLMLSELYYSEEIQELPDIPTPEVNKKHLKLIEQNFESVEEVDYGQIKDSYAERVVQLLENPEEFKKEIEEMKKPEKMVGIEEMLKAGVKT